MRSLFRRLSSIGLLAAAGGSFLAVNPAPAIAQTTLVVGDASGAPGASGIVVQVRTTAAIDVGSTDIGFRFDPGVAQVTAVQGAGLSNFTFRIDNPAGEVRTASATGTVDRIAADAVLFSVTLSVQSSPTATMSALTVFDEDDIPPDDLAGPVPPIPPLSIGYTVQPGTLTVLEAPVSPTPTDTSEVTPTETSVPTETPTPQLETTLVVGSASGEPGESGIEVRVTTTQAITVGSTDLGFTFDPGVLQVTAVSSPALANFTFNIDNTNGEVRTASAIGSDSIAADAVLLVITLSVHESPTAASSQLRLYDVDEMPPDDFAGPIPPVPPASIVYSVESGSFTVVGFTPVPTPTIEPTATPTVVASCAGDCDGDGAVTIEELVRGVNIALGNATLDTCPAFDRGGDGTVTIDDLVAGVGNALNGC